MKRMKKFLVGLLACLSALCGLLGFVACGGTDSSSGAGEATEFESVRAIRRVCASGRANATFL